ncbi:F0F1 ATP synthase subunit delta [Bacillus fonticola]|uniref:F0F1 ATP synthase subunit delta n=1 Tax=Bacillus fonticola TaxID=2728853 RepID=UPI001475A040|nr:F0F1 ATP synthase subunit delta [Bacillus fonticola]
MSVVAKRYALALFELVKAQGQLDEVEAELREIRQAIRTTPELVTVLQSPKLSSEKKKELVKGAFAGAAPYVLNMLQLLVERHRETEIATVAEQFIALANEEKGIAEAVVTSARPLTAEEKASLSDVFAAKVGKQTLRITNEVDSELLGGVRIKIGNRIYDGSLRGKLNRLERELA